MVFDKPPRDKIKPRDPADLLRRRIEKNHPGESPKTIASIIERVREIDTEIRTR